MAFPQHDPPKNRKNFDRVANEEILRRVGVRRELLAAIAKKIQLSFLGHVARKEGAEGVSF